MEHVVAYIWGYSAIGAALVVLAGFYLSLRSSKSKPRYQVHEVGRLKYDGVEVGDEFAGGVVVDGLWYWCKDQTLIVTYHGDEL